jgi:hypothetical protein
MSKNKFIWSLACAAACTLAVSTGACGGSGASSSGTGSSSGAGSSSGTGGGDDASTGSQGGSPACTTNADCTSQVPPTMPANCAQGTCNALQGVCVFSAKDEDGDGHPAANCKSTNGVAVQSGDDCNDNDPNLYPGHSEPCTAAPDGGVLPMPKGVSSSVACQGGLLSCLPGGVESACVNAVPLCPENRTCIGGSCTGECGPGETQCSGNSALQTCEATGTWGAPVQCTGRACVVAADAGTGSRVASCGGACSPGTTQCGTGSMAKYVQTCDGTGAWTTATVACTDVCSAGQCAGNCAPGQTECGTSNNVLTCPTSGSWPTSGGTSCTGQGKACIQTGTTGNPSATCGGSCVPGVQGACGPCGKGTETCTASGTPGPCSGDPPVTATCGPCSDGTSSCGGACQGGTTNPGQTCGSCGGVIQCGGACSASTPVNFGQTCNSCGGTIGCDSNCDGSQAATWNEGDSGTINLDFNQNYCTSNTVNWTWSPNFNGSRTNPSGTYMFNYSFSNHNNMSNSTSTTFYIGCSSNPTAGNAYSEYRIQSGFGATLICPVGDSVVYYPVQCGESGNCCGDPSVDMDVTSWTSTNAICSP